MPYVSEAQRGKFHAMEERGEISPETVKEWDKASKGKKLPKHVKKAADLGFALGYAGEVEKLGAGQVKEGGIASLLGRLGTGIQRGARAFGKPWGVDPLAWMRAGKGGAGFDASATNALRAKALGAAAAGLGLYGGYRMLGGGGQPQQPPQPRPQYIQATPYYPMGTAPY